jgi:hypothetical protein
MNPDLAQWSPQNAPARPKPPDKPSAHNDQPPASPPQPASTPPRKKKQQTRAAFDDRDHFSKALREAMRIIHFGWQKSITRPNVAEAFRKTNDPKLRRCDDRRIRDWCSSKRYDVDFDALAAEAEAENPPGNPPGNPPSLI